MSSSSGSSAHCEIVPVEDGKTDQDSGVTGSSSKPENFKKFDIVEDVSDHYYATRSTPMKQPSKNWVKKIQEEWRILNKNLPDMIFVRVYESRMDLLRAVIVGAEGTPYHDGLFFFDICFPSNYPDAPPKVYYHSRGLRINPNLYASGKVCLSLLNTWHGFGNEKWMPRASNMFQVLVSIQGLILNVKPYFNEPGFARWRGSASGEKRAMRYNQRTLVLSLKTMVYVIRKPPKHFEDMVIEHFRDRAYGILMTCKAYCEGDRVGCLVERGKGKGPSRHYKSGVEKITKMLVSEFEQIGVKDTEEFKSVGENGSLIGKIRSFFRMCLCPGELLI